jgi:chorismate mutase
MYALRGAIGVEADTIEAIDSASVAVVRALLERNAIVTASVVSALFTATPDLRATYPATGARRALLHDTPVMSAAEVDVPGGPARIVRVLMHVAGPKPAHVHHCFLGRAASLRPDFDSDRGSDRP